MSRYYFRLGRIKRLQLRRGFRGRLVLQVAREQFRFTSPFDHERVGIGKFEDARADDLAEVAEIMRALSSIDLRADDADAPANPVPQPQPQVTPN